MIKTITPDRNRAEEFINNFDSKKWAEEVRRVFGKTAPEILAVEEKNGKNLPENHAKRLDAIISNWDKIQAIIARELPDSEKVRALMEQVGEPTKPSDIGVCKKDVLDAYFGTREIRNKYICSALLWDLGMYDDAVNLVSNLEL